MVSRSSEPARQGRLNDGVKQRIIGALVLVALAVIFLPSLFDREGTRYIDITSQIPTPPDIQPITIAEPTPVAGIEAAPALTDAFQPAVVEQTGPAPDPKALVQPATASHASLSDESAEPAPPHAAGLASKSAADSPAKTDPEPRSIADTTPILNDKGLPEAWVVQVGAYREQASAERIRSGLMDKGYRAYTREADTAKGRIVRVFVGPKISRADAQSVKVELDKLLKTQTLVLRFKA